MKYLIAAIIFSILYGIWEQWRVRKGWRSGKKILFDHFSWYHIKMGALFLLVTFILDCNWWMFPLMILVEDITFFVFGPIKLNKDSWVVWELGGIDFKIFYLPYMYLILVGLTVIFKMIWSIL